uniref:Uncharacterized protein n=1 Tax=Megaselia scalaris TaxID=36166 RepID=T1H0A5_MEGSC
MLRLHDSLEIDCTDRNSRRNSISSTNALTVGYKFLGGHLNICYLLSLL